MFGPDGGTDTVFANTGMNHPTGLAVDSAGNVYVAHQIGGTILKYGPGGGTGTVFATGVDNPEGLAIDSSGKVYVANSYQNTILEVRGSALF